MKRRTFLSLMGAAALTSSMMLTGCGAGTGDLRHDADAAIADHRQPRRYRALCTGSADRIGL